MASIQTDDLDIGIDFKDAGPRDAPVEVAAQLVRHSVSSVRPHNNPR